MKCCWRLRWPQIWGREAVLPGWRVWAHWTDRSSQFINKCIHVRCFSRLFFKINYVLFFHYCWHGLTTVMWRKPFLIYVREFWLQIVLVFQESCLCLQKKEEVHADHHPVSVWGGGLTPSIEADVALSVLLGEWALLLRNISVTPVFLASPNHGVSWQCRADWATGGKLLQVE